MIFQNSYDEKITLGSLIFRGYEMKDCNESFMRYVPQFLRVVKNPCYEFENIVGKEIILSDWIKFKPNERMILGENYKKFVPEKLIIIKKYNPETILKTTLSGDYILVSNEESIVDWNSLQKLITRKEQVTCTYCSDIGRIINQNNGEMLQCPICSVNMIQPTTGEKQIGKLGNRKINL